MSELSKEDIKELAEVIAKYRIANFKSVNFICVIESGIAKIINDFISSSERHEKNKEELETLLKKREEEEAYHEDRKREEKKLYEIKRMKRAGMLI